MLRNKFDRSQVALVLLPYLSVVSLDPPCAIAVDEDFQPRAERVAYHHHPQQDMAPSGRPACRVPSRRTAQPAWQRQRGHGSTLPGIRSHQGMRDCCIGSDGRSSRVPLHHLVRLTQCREHRVGCGDIYGLDHPAAAFLGKSHHVGVYSRCAPSTSLMHTAYAATWKWCSG